MLHRSLGARSLAEFWRYWNPIWGYYLGKYVFRPSRGVLPPALAVILTFLVSGAVHDLAVTAVKGSVNVLFVPWFFLMSIGLLLGEAAGMDLHVYPWIVRAGVNLLYVGGCLGLTLWWIG